MKEVKRVFTVEITIVENGYEQYMISQEEAKTDMENELKEQDFANFVDDIKVVKIQDFVRDVQTNFGRIKGMGKDELAAFLMRITDDCYGCGAENCFDEKNCTLGECRGSIREFKNWLDEESK